MMKIQESMKFSSLIPKFKHGSKFPLQGRWVSSSRLNTSAVVGVLSAVGVILIAKDKKFWELIGVLFSSDEAISSPRFWAVPGLENLGNNCFLNVILQALSSCSSFRKYIGDIVQCEVLSVEEGDETMPLVSSLTLLMEELGTIRHRRTVLSPRKLMLAMAHYKPNFNLTRQQDAEEAFCHLLSLLREEQSQHYVPNKSYLSDLPALPCGRIISKSNEDESEWLRWKRVFLGPFDGILGSILICLSCSFQISLDFQQFHSLHLSPPTSSNGIIVDGCTLEDCLKCFFIAEHLENYCCSNCWHNAAINYLSAVSNNKADYEILQFCNRNDSCDCKTLSSLESFPWSNRSSQIFKPLSLARSPKILSIHLQRASYDMFGQSVKLLGHLSFPMILDLSSFTNCELGIGILEKISRFWPAYEKYKLSFPHSMYQNMQLSLGVQKNVLVAENCSCQAEAAGEYERNATRYQNGHCSSASEDVPSLLIPRKRAYGNVGFSLKASEAGEGLFSSRKFGDGNVGVSLPSAPSKSQKYRLVSVVEHFGSGGGGHYTVYRRVTAKIDDEDPAALLESAIEQWYCISDSEVHAVSEKDVLGSNASMLFYEKF